ncbi:virB8 family protein [Sphingobium sp. YR768]|uniref:virB8 family protein n=1 Tax=Sphingobium sp. YR768 TaxID=1884365 RepID=UPI0008AAAD1C|nr:type IV secretion system protein [Sphingobium sp. YR768]SES13770.1 type IV secretion system protein VirB8 [Sphingobium sp. YR768]
MIDKTGKADKTAIDREAYYARAISWAEDGQERLRQSRRIAWIIAGMACGIALLAILAIVLMMPLKTVESNTLLVDRTTGYVQLLKGDGRQRLAPDTALTQSLLAQYVIAREQFDINSIQADYRKVGLWSAERARSDYMAMMPASNPASPFQRFPRTTLLAVRIKSVSPLGPNIAQIRFETERRDQGQVDGPRQAWVSIVRYRFIDAPMAMEDRLINPLGFQVLRYRRDQEAPEPMTAPAGTTPNGLPSQAAVPAAPPAQSQASRP